MSERHQLPFLVAVETDPLRYHGENAVRPAPLSLKESEQLLAHIAADLGKLFPDIHQHGLVLAGVLYDQAQVLRPGLPLFRAMAEVARRRWKQHGRRTGLLSLGTADGQLPRQELVPDPALPPGVLQLLCLQLHGDADALRTLEDEMEHRFMEEGQLSPLSARALERAFGVASTHVRFLTVTDLLAMLKLQLEHFGFPALWRLIDAALESAPPCEVRGEGGQRFRWFDGAVHAEFETFDHWARHGGGRELPADELAESYVAWTREYRQLLITLAAHGVRVEQHLPGSDESLTGLFLEESGAAAGEQANAITEHDGGELGILAVTVAQDGKLRHFYPLAPEGSNALHAHIAGLGIAHEGLSFPGHICFDPAHRRLAADCQ